MSYKLQDTAAQKDTLTINPTHQPDRVQLQAAKRRQKGEYGIGSNALLVLGDDTRQQHARTMMARCDRTIVIAVRHASRSQ